jgi:hypothetical protein
MKLRLENLVFFLLIISLSSCGQRKVLPQTFEDTGKTMTNSSNNLNSKSVSGRYGDLSVAVDSLSQITGVYEFYNAWDDQYKEYMQINVFYFNGKLNGNIASIKTAWPTSEQKLSGKLTVKDDSVKLLLNEMPDGYAAIDFTKGDGFSHKITEPQKWKQIRVVKVSKAKLFNSPDSSHPRKGYLIQNDIVKVVFIENNGWLKIEFDKPNKRDNSLQAWINENQLFDIDPEKWKVVK